MNEIARIEIQQEWLSGTASTQVQEQDETWQIDKSSQSTMSPNVQRIDVKVSIYDRDVNKTTGQITQLTFFNYRQGQNGSS
jgi:general secretion pathway protein I